MKELKGRRGEFFCQLGKSYRTIYSKKCGPDVSILAGPLSKVLPLIKGPARIETSGPQFLGYLHFGHFSQ